MKVEAKRRKRGRKVGSNSKFGIGMEVEVTSDEEGFRGAWYSAKVVEAPATATETDCEEEKEEENEKVYVEYCNLVSDENKSILLKEFVDVEFVRPKPPIEELNSFQVNDIVDAFYQDGWWCGIVTQVILDKDTPKKLFRVSFSNPPDEHVFNFTHLRLHKDWIHGNWLLPTPPPPPPPPKTFHLLEKVDAFDDSRWFSGVVTKILADGRYIVYFNRTKKEKEFTFNHLRLHMDSHSHSHSQDTSMKSNSENQSNTVVNGGNKEKTHASPEGSDAGENNGLSDRISTTNLRSGQKELQTLRIEKTNHNSNKRDTQTSVNGDASRSRPPRRTNGEPADVETSNHEIPAHFDCPISDHHDLKQGETNNQQFETRTKDDNEKLSVPRKRGRPPKLRGLVSGDALGVTAVETPSKSDVLKSALGPIVVGLTHNGKIIDSLGATSNHNLELEHKKAVKDEEKNMDGPKRVLSNGCEQAKEGEFTNLKKKRGRPVKRLLRVGDPKTNQTESMEQDNKDDASDARDDDKRETPISEIEKHIAIAEPYGTSDSVPLIRPVMKINDKMKRASDIRRCSMISTFRKQITKGEIPKGSIMHDLNDPVKSIIVRKGKKQKSKKQVESETEDAVDNLRIHAIEGVTNRDKAVARTSSNGPDDDKPLSAWFEGAVSLNFGVHAVRTVGPPDRTALVDQVKEQDKIEYTSSEIVCQALESGLGRPEEIVMQSQAAAIVPVEEGDFPFAKTSLVWQLIENMEVLKRIPQKPHFQPLYNCKEECREGLAIGSMVTFTSLVERISKTRSSDSRSLLDGYLEALVDLEELGFNVSPVRERLNKLLSLKCKYEEAQNTAKETESRMMECNLEKSTINGEMAELDRKIGELMEKRTILMSKKERKEAEVILLKTSIESVKDTLETTEKEFENIASSLW